MDDFSELDSLGALSPVRTAPGADQQQNDAQGAQRYLYGGAQHFGLGSASSSGANIAGVTTQLVDTKFVARPGKFSA